MRNVSKCKLYIILYIFLLFSVFRPSSFFAKADDVSMLEIGTVVNAKMKSLAANTKKEYSDGTSNIKAIHMADSLPDNFIPSDINIVSAPDSSYPIYIFFDDEEDAGIMYFYTESDTIVLNPDSSYIFFNYAALTDLSGLACWDSSSVVTLQGAFMRDSSLSEL